MNLTPTTQQANRRAICLHQGALLAMVFRLNRLVNIDAFFFATSLDHPEEFVLVGDISPENESLIVLAGRVAVLVYLGIPIDSDCDEMVHALKLAKQDSPENPAQKRDEWISIVAAAFKVDQELAFLALKLTDELDKAGALSGSQVYLISEPYVSRFSGRAPSPIGPLRIVRSESASEAQANFQHSKFK